MEVSVIGAGAAGLIAAYAAARNNNSVTVYERNDKCGKKIYITGKGRCNVTNCVPPYEFLKNVVNNSKFMTGAINNFTPEDLMALLEEGGLRLKTERGNRVFPISDKASDVTKCLEKLCKNVGVKFVFNAKVQKIKVLNSTMSDIIVEIDGKSNTIKTDKVIVCTGGISYPSTGSTGDGYFFARETGHNIIEPKPALCGINLKGNYFSALQGLSLKNVNLTTFYNSKKLCSQFGELMFTHFGISGPIVLTVSSLINRLDLSSVKLSLDLKPALTCEQLNERLLREFSLTPNKSVKAVMKSLLPAALIDEVLKRANVDFDKKVNSVSRVERNALINVFKNFEMQPISLRSFNEAIVTSGGVDVKQINPKTMESKLVNGLYFCGEVLDVDAFTGGFNLQIAFSTGYAAGSSIFDD
ncbi:MAG: NAD(P)/FAD-dependent oxidoreductase [Candidatus Coproplasma sp.]